MLDEREYESLISFVEEFYEIIKDDDDFKKKIVDQCRTE
jgi:hypothetical protein